MKQSETSQFGRNSIKRAFTSKIGIITGIVLLSAFFAILSPNFLELNNFFNIVRQQSLYVLLALGMTQIIIIGNIDLSVGSCVALCGVTSALFMQNVCNNAFLAILVTLLVGTILGLVNGVAAAYFNMPPYIVTLATQTIFRGAAMLITDGYPVNVKNSTFEAIGRGDVFGIPAPFVIVLCFVAITWIILNRTSLGRRIYAVGGNSEAAHLAGVNVKGIVTYVHGMMGLLCGASAIIMVGRLATGAPNTGTGYEGQAISASVLGGAVMGTGVGTAVGALLGALFIGILNNGMTLLRLSTYWQDVVRGCVIFLVVLVSVMSAGKGTGNTLMDKIKAIFNQGSSEKTNIK